MRATRNRNEEHGEYKLCYIQNKPLSLTITKKPKIILSSLYQLCSYIWITEDASNTAKLKEQFKQKMREKLICVESVKEVKEHVEKAKMSVIICKDAIIKQVNKELKEIINSQQITEIVCFGHRKIRKFKKTFQVSSYEKVFSYLRDNKTIYNKSFQYSNFIFLSSQIWDSNNLVRTLFAMINQQTCKEQLINQLGDLAELVEPIQIQNIKKFISSYKTGSLSYELAIQWYTKHSFLYRLVNGLLRLNRQATSLYIIQPYFQDLFGSIHQLYKKQQKESEEFQKIICYRGAQISQRELKFSRLHQKLIIQNLGFLSASLDQQEAKRFIVNAFFEIQVDDQPRQSSIDFGFGFVEKYSQSPEEREVLFNPFNTFKVVEVSHYDSSKNFYFIKLKYGSMAKAMAVPKENRTQQENELANKGRYQLEQSEKCKCIGEVLINLNFNKNIEGSEIYCNKFWQIANESQNHIQINHAHLLKGILAKNNGQFEEAQNQFWKCARFVQTHYGKKTKAYVETLNVLGNIQMRLNKYHSAIWSLSQCKSLFGQLMGKNHPGYAAIVNNLGICYNNFYTALDSYEQYQKCRNIQISTFGKNYPDYGKTLNNLGSSLDKLGFYQSALQQFEQSQQILKKSLGEKHTQYMNVVENIRKTLQQLQNQNQEKENIQIQTLHLESFQTPFKDYLEICMFAIFQVLDIDLKYDLKKQLLDKNQYGQIMVQMNQEKKELAKIIFQRIKLKQKFDIQLHTPQNSPSLQILTSLNKLIGCMFNVCDQIPNSVQQFESAQKQFKQKKEEIRWMIYDQFY